MIDKQRLSEVVESYLEGTPMFVTEIAVSPDNNIRVEIDSDESVDIDACAAITRAIGDAFDRDAEDYELEVGSAGITSPLRLPRQYAKYVGKDLEVLTADGRKLHGVLAATDGEGDAFGFTIEVPVKIKEPGQKKPRMGVESIRLTPAECKLVRYDLKF